MTVDEARQILIRRKELLHRIDKLQKKGEKTDSMTLLKLLRKRREGLAQQEEAEFLMRKADRTFYQQWVGEILEQPDSWTFQQFQAQVQLRMDLVRKALTMREKDTVGSVCVDTPHALRLSFPHLDETDWQATVASSPYFTEQQRSLLLRKAAILQHFYTLFDQWVEPMRSVSPDYVDVDFYTENAVRVMWVLPGDLPLQSQPLPRVLRKCEQWAQFPYSTDAYLKLFYTSFVVQQLYFYAADREDRLSYDAVNRYGSLEEWYKSLRRSAIVHLNHCSLSQLRALLLTLQPNVVLAAGTLPQIWEALGEFDRPEQLNLLTGLSESCGIATLHRYQGIAFIETPQPVDPEVSVREFMTDVLSLARLFWGGSRLSGEQPEVLNRAFDLSRSCYEILQQAIHRHRYVRMSYPDPQTLHYEEHIFLPLLLKQHAGDWFVIGKWKGHAAIEALYLSQIFAAEELEDEERVSEQLLLPYRYAYGVHMRKDLRINANLTNAEPQLFVIRLRVYAPLYQQFLLRPLHFTQSLFSAQTGASFRLFQYKMYLTDELIQLLRGYGRLIEVIEPDCLRQEIL